MLTRKDYVNHILKMKKYDEEYARWALEQYHAAMPEMDLMAGVRDALKAAK